MDCPFKMTCYNCVEPKGILEAYPQVCSHDFNVIFFLIFAIGGSLAALSLYCVEPGGILEAEPLRLIYVILIHLFDISDSRQSRGTVPLKVHKREIF